MVYKVLICMLIIAVISAVPANNEQREKILHPNFVNYNKIHKRDALSVDGKASLAMNLQQQSQNKNNLPPLWFRDQSAEGYTGSPRDKIDFLGRIQQWKQAQMLSARDHRIKKISNNQ